MYIYASLFIITYMYFNAKTVHGMTYTTSLSISCLLWVCKFFYVMNRPSDSHYNNQSLRQLIRRGDGSIIRVKYGIKMNLPASKHISFHNNTIST